MASRTGKAPSFFEVYTRGLTQADVERLFTRDTPEAYRFFARNLDLEKLATEPWYRRWAIHARLFFVAFTMRLSPARRVLYAFGLAASLLGMIQLFRGFAPVRLLLFPFTISLPLPHWTDGASALAIGFLAANLLILMEVADRLSLKGDLEIARDIQLAMLPGGIHEAGDAVTCGLTRPANTVGGDFYDILQVPDGRLVLALGDVAGKGTPAALLMALLLAMLRTLVDEGLESSRLVARLNVQIARHSPASRFITLFYGLYDPRDGSLQYVNAGHLPPFIRRKDGRFERLEGNGLALGMFDRATYDAHRVVIESSDVLVLFSDGITEAEDRSGRAFEEAGIEQVVTQWAGEVPAARNPQTLAQAILAAVEAHAGDSRLADDLTVLVLKRAES
jgi:sigma-B regulation protein RsbU (phosphoserine phosphatase)